MNAIARWRGWTTPGRGLAALIVTALVLTVAGVPATASDDGMVEATYTYTDTQTVTVDETHTIGEFVGHGSATATASATVTKTVRKPSDWEAYYYSIWESYLAAVQEAHDKAVAEAQPIAKKKAEEDARAKADAGVTFSFTATESATVTATEDYTIGDNIGHGTATATESATVTKTVTKPTSWEAYYYAVVESSEAAKAAAKDKARETAKAEALAKAKADAEEQAAQEAQKPTPSDPTSGAGDTPTTPTAPSCGTDPTKADGSKWECTFSDDFRGTTLDRSKWSPITTENSQLSYGDCWVDSPNNIKVADGAAQLSTRKVQDEVSCGNGVKSNYTSGSLSSVGKFSQAFGRYEIRAAMPKTNGKGLHSALWLWPDAQRYGSTWPASGEIDIVEFYSKYPDRLIPALHYNSSLPWSTRTNNECLVEDPTKYHTYTLEWTPQSLTVGIDGTTCVEHKISPLAPLSGAAPFDKPFYLNLTQSLGASDNSLPAGTEIGDDVTMKVDYVKVWK